jgi:hypothetical protein
MKTWPRRQVDRLEGLSVLGIEHSKNNMVGRGALLEPSGIPPPTRPRRPVLS